MTSVLTPGPLFSAPEFTFGVATSSFQIEGGRDSREPCIWDTFCRTPGAIADGSHGDVACDHIHHWQQDLDLVRAMHMDAYRFSISWPRVMHADGSINQAGLDFYEQIVDYCATHNIKTYVTLYHWDLPQYLEDAGGWLNRATAEAFVEYARAVVTRLGNKVYSYATLNEPFCSAYLGYEAGIHAPGKQGKQNGKKAVHHLLLAHGLAMPVLRALAPAASHGIVLNFTPYYPASADPADEQATALAHSHHNDWYIRPLLTGCYPDLLTRLPADQQPHIEPGDMNIIAAPLDFLGVNYYTRSRVAADGTDDFSLLAPPSQAAVTAMGWEVYPQGLTDLLVQLHRDYNLPPVMITENGMACEDTLKQGEVRDKARIAYLQSHMNAVEAAAAQGVEITGYFVWSLLDNFEWSLGYTKRFGIVYVDYTTQQRITKSSAKALEHMLQKRAR